MLQALVEYSLKLPDPPEPGFTITGVKWEVQVDDEGKFVNVLPLGDDDGEEIKCPLMHNMVAGGRAHFLVESAQTAALLFRKNTKPEEIQSATIKHQFFQKRTADAANDVACLMPLATFLSCKNEVDKLNQKLLSENADPNDRLKWRVSGVDVVAENSVRSWWRNWRVSDIKKVITPQKIRKNAKTGDCEASGKMICLVSGEYVEPLETHDKIKKLRSVGGLPTGDVLVGFDKSSFCSFGLKKSANAAMRDVVASCYVAGLNHLIKNHSRKLANTLVVHWFKEPVAKENDPLWFLSVPPELTEGAAQQSAREILEALRKGQRPVPPDNRFYAMTLSGASGRVMVRDWMEGSFDDLVARIEQWFYDLEIVARDGGKSAPEPKFMAVCGAIVRDLKDLPAPTATTLWRVALSGLPIPQPFIAQALARFKADLIDDKPFNHARMGLLKAYFIRKGGNHQMSAYLNKEHPEPAYQCGRLLAVLASLQRAALGDIGAGVVQRYYVAASQTPGLTLGRLFNNAKNHLNKLDGGLTYWYEDQIAEIMSRIQDRIPSTLNLDQQSLFALGYYQQIAANRAGKNTTTNETKGDNQ